MDRKEARSVMQYLAAIPGMAQLLRNERAELEIEYSTLRATEMDGMPRSGTPGTPVESLALVMVEKGTAERVNEINRRLAILDEDRLSITQHLDELCGRYKSVLMMRYIRGYSWGKMSCVLETPDSTVRHWHDKALEALGSALCKADFKALFERASRARI